MEVEGRTFYTVSLEDDEQAHLQDIVDRGKGSKEHRKRARL